MGQIDEGVNQMGNVKDAANGQSDREGDVTMGNEQVSSKEENFSDDTAVMQEEEDEDEKISTPTLAIPSKSRSLRTTSVRKRLEIEVKMKQPKTKGRISKKARLSKYRRKSANAKERERMKKQNDVFEVLKQILPCDKAKKKEEDKETKVTTLRSAIEYINSLQSLLDDCEAGRLDSSLVRQCSLTSTTGQRKKKKPSSKKKANSATNNNKERLVEPKWTHYSKQDLRTKFGGRTPPQQSQFERRTPPQCQFEGRTPPPPYHLPPSPPPYHLPSIVTTISPPPPYCRTTTTYLCQAPTTIVLPPSPPSCSPSPPSFATTTTSTVLYTEAELSPNSSSPPSSPSSTSSSLCYSRPPSSPRDVNEISLHISLIDSQGSYLPAGRPVPSSKSSISCQTEE